MKVLTAWPLAGERERESLRESVCVCVMALCELVLLWLEPLQANLVKHLAGTSTMEVEAFQYDEGIHKMENIETLKDFFRLLRVKSSLPPTL